MWYPKSRQWAAIWVVTLLILSVWLVSDTSFERLFLRLSVALLIINGLIVWGTARG